jgi:hypothetical protein
MASTVNGAAAAPPAPGAMAGKLDTESRTTASAGWTLRRTARATAAPTRPSFRIVTASPAVSPGARTPSPSSAADS